MRLLLELISPYALHGGKPGCVAYYAHWQREQALLPMLLEALHCSGLRTEWENEPPQTTLAVEPVELVNYNNPQIGLLWFPMCFVFSDFDMRQL